MFPARVLMYQKESIVLHLYGYLSDKVEPDWVCGVCARYVIFIHSRHRLDLPYTDFGVLEDVMVLRNEWETSTV